jgi:hypothetical protein
MQTQRFDEWTAALVRGGSRRGVLRGLAGGVLGAFALDRSGALAKNDNANGGGKPITILAKPVCDELGLAEDCPLCAGAKADCCDLTRGEQFCGTKAIGVSCAQPNTDSCGSSCVTATCTEPSDKQPENGLRCAYTKTDVCTTSGATFCCARFSSPNFGNCVKSTKQC